MNNISIGQSRKIFYTIRLEKYFALVKFIATMKFEDLPPYVSVFKDISIGSVAGTVCGYLTVKLGKVMVFSIIGTMILLQFAHYQGYLQGDFWVSKF